MTTQLLWEKGKPTVCVDLDGVLAQYEGWQGVSHIGDPLPGAREFLEKLCQRVNVLIFTTRCSIHGPEQAAEGWSADRLHRLVVDWLHGHYMPFHDVWVGQGKPFAAAYVDDRAVPCMPLTGEEGVKVNDQYYQGVLNHCENLIKG